MILRALFIVLFMSADVVGVVPPSNPVRFHGYQAFGRSFIAAFVNRGCTGILSPRGRRGQSRAMPAPSSPDRRGLHSASSQSWRRLLIQLPRSCAMLGGNRCRDFCQVYNNSKSLCTVEIIADRAPIYFSVCPPYAHYILLHHTLFVKNERPAGRPSYIALLPFFRHHCWRVAFGSEQKRRMSKR